MIFIKSLSGGRWRRSKLTLLNILWAIVAIFQKGFPEQSRASLLMLLLIVITILMADLLETCLEKYRTLGGRLMFSKTGFSWMKLPCAAWCGDFKHIRMYAFSEDRFFCVCRESFPLYRWKTGRWGKYQRVGANMGTFQKGTAESLCEWAGNGLTLLLCGIFLPNWVVQKGVPLRSGVGVGGVNLDLWCCLVGWESFLQECNQTYADNYIWLYKLTAETELENATRRSLWLYVNFFPGNHVWTRGNRVYFISGSLICRVNNSKPDRGRIRVFGIHFKLYVVPPAGDRAG